METQTYEMSRRGFESSGNLDKIVTAATQVKPLPLIKAKPNLTYRHYKALMLKNALIWRRTWFGSFLEILCPIVLMLIVCYGRYILRPSFFA